MMVVIGGGNVGDSGSSDGPSHRGEYFADGTGSADNSCIGMVNVMVAVSMVIVMVVVVVVLIAVV